MLWKDLLLVCAGGAAGSGARFLASAGALRLWGPAFPWGTLVVNVSGALCIGLVMQAVAEQKIHSGLRLLLASGFLGGFTTFSTFSFETLRLWQVGSPSLAALNAGANLAACLLATLAGVWLGRALFG